MLIGYPLVLTEEPSLDLQLDALKRAGCKRIFTPKVSTTKADDPGLAEAVSHLRDRDVLVIWKLDRLARTVRGPKSRGFDLDAVLLGSCDESVSLGRGENSVPSHRE
jgi:DNA invertase Pin-like site-specific DNA recombinase